MSEFKNVTIIREANVYFNGSVTSRTIIFDSGSKKTLGLMMLGDYEFKTGSAELMEILSGDLEVLLPGAASWQPIKGGESFKIPANATFNVKVKSLTDYCCSYFD